MILNNTLTVIIKRVHEKGNKIEEDNVGEIINEILEHLYNEEKEEYEFN